MKKIHRLHILVTVSLFLGALFTSCGTYWDGQYHLDVGRDSFWIHPHLLIYFGALLVLFGGVVGVLWSRTFRNKTIVKKLAYVLGNIALGAVLIFTAAPIDDLYHRLVGIDATVWSPPHFLLILGALVSFTGFLIFQIYYLHLVHEEHGILISSNKISFEFMAALILVGLNIVVMEFEYYRSSTAHLTNASLSRPSWWLLLLYTVFLFFIFSLAKTLLTQKWLAVSIALWYMLVRIGLSAALFISGGSWPILPPLAIVGAVIFDLVTNKKLNWQSIFWGSLVGSILFYVAEVFYLPLVDGARFVPKGGQEIIWGVLAGATASFIGFFIGKRVIHHLKI